MLFDNLIMIKWPHEYDDQKIAFLLMKFVKLKLGMKGLILFIYYKYKSKRFKFNLNFKAYCLMDGVWKGFLIPFRTVL